MTPGLVRVATPALPGGTRLRCTTCGVHVPNDHQPDGADCHLLQDERRHKRQH